MSYLRALVRKTQSLRPAIAPRLPAPVAPPGLGLTELVEDVIVTSSRSAPPVVPTSAATPTADVSPPLPPAAATSDGARRRDEPASAFATDLVRPAARVAVEPLAPLHQTVSRSSRLISRRLTAPQSGETPEPDAAPPPADRDDRPLVARRNLPPSALEASPYPRVSPAAPAPAFTRERDVERPDVQISIGRLEVRAHVAAPAKAERLAPFRPQVTLQDYLTRRSGGQ